MKRGKWRWPVCMVVELAAVMLLTLALVSASLFFPSPASNMVYALAMWGLIPLLGAGAAFGLTRKGLSNYIAWILPPAGQTAAHWLLVGFPPQSAGMPLLTAALSLVSAAAAQVLNEREDRRESTNGRREGK